MVSGEALDSRATSYASHSNAPQAEVTAAAGEAFVVQPGFEGVDGHLDRNRAGDASDPAVARTAANVVSTRPVVVASPPFRPPYHRSVVPVPGVVGAAHPIRGETDRATRTR